MSGPQQPRYGVCVSNFWDEDGCGATLLGPFPTFDAAWAAALTPVTGDKFPHDPTLLGYEVRVFPVGANEDFASLSETDVSNRDSTLVLEVVTKLIQLEKPAAPPVFAEDTRAR